MNKTDTRVTPVLLGADLNAYSMAYAFYSAFGVKSHVFARARLGLTDNSRFISLYIEPSLDDVNVAVPLLVDFAKAHKGENLVLVPCADWYMEMLEYSRDRLKEYFYFNIPPFCIWRVASDKSSLYRLLDKFAIPYPKMISYKEKSNLADILRGLSMPLVLKAADSSEYFRHKFPGMRKVYFVDSEAQIREITEKIYASGYLGSLILQEQVGKGPTGREASVFTCYCDSSSRVIMAAAGDILLEENAPTAIGNYSAIIARPLGEIEFKLMKMLEKIGYRGFANFDIISDERGSYCLELNPRQGRSSDYLRSIGINTAELIFNDMMGYKSESNIYSREALWLAVPMSIVRLHATNKALLKRAEELYRLGCVCSVYDIKEPSFKRKLYNFLHKVTQRRNFKKYGKGVL